MGLTILLVIFAAIYFLIKKNPYTISMNRKWTYVILTAYIVILLIATLTVDFIDNKFTADQPLAEDFTEVDNKIRNGNLELIDPSQLIDRRTHEIGDTLTITSTGDQFIYIERKDGKDGLVEETIFKPLLSIGDIDFSEHVGYTLPEWDGDTVTFMSQPYTKLSYNTYHDGILVGQFTRNSRQEKGFNSSASRPISFHLLVPKDLNINAEEHLFIEYINE